MPLISLDHTRAKAVPSRKTFTVNKEDFQGVKDQVANTTVWELTGNANNRRASELTYQKGVMSVLDNITQK